MKKATLMVVAAVLMLTGCTAGRMGTSSDSLPVLSGFSSLLVQRPVPGNPNVFIFDDIIVINQEPTLPLKGSDRKNRIAWSLEQNGDYKFPDSAAIEIKKLDGSAVAAVYQTVANGYAVFCTYDAPAPRTLYKYTITVLGPQKLQLDPMIMN